MKVLKKKDIDKPRKRRLRKKLKLGEFRECGFNVEISVSASASITLDASLDEWIGFVESNRWAFGGGVSDKKIEGFVASQFNMSLTQDNRVLLAEWLSQADWVESFCIGELSDAWHG